MTLQEEWQAKVKDIAAHIGRELFGDGPLTPEQQAEADDAADEAIDEWEMAEVEQVAGVEAKTPLQRRLAEQHELAERILDEQDAKLTDDDKDLGLSDD